MTKKEKILTAIAAVGIVAALYGGYEIFKPEKHILIAIWNVRGYPETDETRRDWFHDKLIDISPDVICIQEIANQGRVDKFLANETHFTSVAFLDSNDGQDNAIFTTEWVEIEDMPDPNGFLHPAQAAYVSYRGFDAVIVTIHLAWSYPEIREQEKVLLQNVVSEMLKKDPDVIIAGDFNTREQGIQELADSIGMKVMVPLGQDGVGTTHAGNRYDHFLISPDLANEALACQIQTFTGDELETAKEVSDQPDKFILSEAQCLGKKNPQNEKNHQDIVGFPRFSPNNNNAFSYWAWEPLTRNLEPPGVFTHSIQAEMVKSTSQHTLAGLANKVLRMLEFLANLAAKSVKSNFRLLRCGEDFGIFMVLQGWSV